MEYGHLLGHGRWNEAKKGRNPPSPRISGPKTKKHIEIGTDLFDDLQNIIVTRLSTIKTKELWRIQLELLYIKKISSILWSGSEVKEQLAECKSSIL
jgi:hypothetical protein